MKIDIRDRRRGKSTGGGGGGGIKRGCGGAGKEKAAQSVQTADLPAWKPLVLTIWPFFCIEIPFILFH